MYESAFGFTSLNLAWHSSLCIHALCQTLFAALSYQLSYEKCVSHLWTKKQWSAGLVYSLEVALVFLQAKLFFFLTQNVKLYQHSRLPKYKIQQKSLSKDSVLTSNIMHPTSTITLPLYSQWECREVMLILNCCINIQGGWSLVFDGKSIRHSTLCQPLCMTATLRNGCCWPTALLLHLQSKTRVGKCAFVDLLSL